MKKIDRVGKKYGKLTVLKMLDNGDYECLCECGEKRIIKHSNMGRTKSCGCLKNKNHLRHGETGSRLYNIWQGMKRRCNDPGRKDEHIYFDRGIKVCKSWWKYENFRDWALRNGYDSTTEPFECTIDRIDNNKGYSPKNCRFVSQKENNRNRRINKLYDFCGEKLYMWEISEKTGTDMATVWRRIYRGWSIEDAALTPKMKVGERRKK